MNGLIFCFLQMGQRKGGSWEGQWCTVEYDRYKQNLRGSSTGRIWIFFFFLELGKMRMICMWGYSRGYVIFDFEEGVKVVGFIDGR